MLGDHFLDGLILLLIYFCLGMRLNFFGWIGEKNMEGLGLFSDFD